MSDQMVSYSEFKAFSECPLRWKLMYVDGLKDERDSIDTVFGTSVHETIQQWLPLHFANPTKAKKPAKATALAHHLMARAFDEGMNSSTRSPARGVNRTIERMCSITMAFRISPSYYHVGPRPMEHGFLSALRLLCALRF